MKESSKVSLCLAPHASPSLIEVLLLPQRVARTSASPNTPPAATSIYFLLKELNRCETLVSPLLCFYNIVLLQLIGNIPRLCGRRNTPVRRSSYPVRRCACLAVSHIQIANVPITTIVTFVHRISSIAMGSACFPQSPNSLSQWEGMSHSVCHDCLRATNS